MASRIVRKLMGLWQSDDPSPRAHSGDWHPFIVGLSKVRNEEDIIEPFVRHNLEFVDMMFIADHGSVDHTRDILIGLQHEGLPVTVFDVAEAGDMQSLQLSRVLTSLSATTFPDFLVPLDADEFIKCESKDVFIGSLESIPGRGVGLVAWVTYIVPPFAIDSGVEDPPRSMTFRRREEHPPYRKVIVRLDGHFDPYCILAEGNHSMIRTNNVEVASVALEGVSLAHFPVRSADQLVAKAVVGWTARLTSFPDARDSGMSYQWQENFDAIMETGDIPLGEVARRSMLYAQERRAVDWETDIVEDPMRFTYHRSLGPATPVPPLSVVGRSWEATLSAQTSFAQRVRSAIGNRQTAMEGESAGPASDEFATVLCTQWHAEHLFADIAPFRYIFERFQPESVLDVGCGLGVILMYLQSRGARRVMGIDGLEESGSLLAREHYLRHDLSRGFSTGARYDLVICTEVVEHLGASAEDELLSSIAAHARELIVFSAAEPGQPGESHRNCRPVAHWIQRWKMLGWEPDPQASVSFRALASLSWFRRNGLVLRRKASGRTKKGSSLPDLAAIGRRQYRWYAQTPRIYEHPFTEDLPPNVYEPLSLP